MRKENPTGTQVLLRSSQGSVPTQASLAFAQRTTFIFFIFALLFQKCYSLRSEMIVDDFVLI
jgi:hypothetical protein